MKYKTKKIDRKQQERLMKQLDEMLKFEFTVIFGKRDYGKRRREDHDIL